MHVYAKKICAHATMPKVKSHLRRMSGPDCQWFDAYLQSFTPELTSAFVLGQALDMFRQAIESGENPPAPSYLSGSSTIQNRSTKFVGQALDRIQPSTAKPYDSQDLELLDAIHEDPEVMQTLLDFVRWNRKRKPEIYEGKTKRINLGADRRKKGREAS